MREAPLPLNQPRQVKLIITMCGLLGITKGRDLQKLKDKNDLHHNMNTVEFLLGMCEQRNITVPAV